jgi:hypothetical protein
MENKQTPESTADYLDRHMIEAMKELAKEGFNPNKKQTMKQTAVEWLEMMVKAMIENGGDLGEDLPALMNHIKQAKEMEKEQRGYTEEQAYEIWKAGIEYWKTSGNTITFEELTEKLKKK